MKKYNKVLLGLLTIIITGLITFFIVDYLIKNSYLTPITKSNIKNSCNYNKKEDKELKKIIEKKHKQLPPVESKKEKIVIKKDILDKNKTISNNETINNKSKDSNNKKIVNNDNISNKHNNLYVLTTGANIRKGPSYKTKELGYLKEGDIVTVFKKEGKYYKTDKGYVYYKALRPLYKVTDTDKNKIIINKQTFLYKDKKLKQKYKKIFPGDEFIGIIEDNVLKVIKDNKTYYISIDSIKPNKSYETILQNKLLENKINLLNKKIDNFEKIVDKIEIIDNLDTFSKKLKKDILINNKNIRILNRKITNIELMVKKSVNKMDELSKIIQNDLNKSFNKNSNLYNKKEITIIKSEIDKLKEQYKILIERNKEFIKEIEKLLNEKDKKIDDKKQNSNKVNKIDYIKAEIPLLKDSPFTYLGFSLNSDGEKEAYITVDGVDVYKVLKGNIINQRWEVEDIKSDKLILLDNETNKLVKILFQKK